MYFIFFIIITKLNPITQFFFIDSTFFVESGGTNIKCASDLNESGSFVDPNEESPFKQFFKIIKPYFISLMEMLRRIYIDEGIKRIFKFDFFDPSTYAPVIRLFFICLRTFLLFYALKWPLWRISLDEYWVKYRNLYLTIRFKAVCVWLRYKYKLLVIFIILNN